MKFTLSWLKDHLDTRASLAEITEALTKIGLEVEGVVDPAKALKPFTVAYVVSAEQHPNADRLRVCMVDTGAGEPVQVVCGAPNARTGMKSVFAPPGSYIPGKQITLGVGTIRGVESRGMLCSGAELELSNDHDGILDLPADAPVGKAYADYAGIDDPVVEINLTPNRPDATSIHGIARDLAAVGLGELREPSLKAVRGAYPCPTKVKLDFAEEDRHLAPLFALRLVRGVRNGPSPDWMQRRLKAIGLRPINALVDITNYLTFDRGRPLHVFDAAKVHGDLTVRRAREGESILALDGRVYMLNPANVVIADENGVESIAGIMGGEASGCDENTTDVLVESALWDPLNIAQSGRALGIITDARYRFERGVDPAMAVPGLDIATNLILDICGGEASAAEIAGQVPDTDRIIEFPISEIKRLTGLKVPPGEIRHVLTRLGFFTAGQGESWKVAIPSWRPDVHEKADLVEEVVRIVGLDRVAPEPLDRGGAVQGQVLTLMQRRRSAARRALAARGLVEAITWSFIARDKAIRFGGGQKALSLANPIAADLSDMRPSLLPGLLDALRRNADRAQDDVALFEVGQVFTGDEPDDQLHAVTGLRHGIAGGRNWRGGAGADAFDAKADALAVLAAVGAPMAKLQIAQGASDVFHPGRSGTIQLGPKNTFAYFGELHPAVVEAFGLEGTVAGFEIVLDRLPSPKLKSTPTKPALDISPFQPVTRDFAFLVDARVAAADLIRAAENADRKLVAGATIFDRYQGKGVPDGKVSLALAVTLQPREKTLTDAEIEAVAAKIVAEIGNRTGAVLRA